RRQWHADGGTRLADRRQARADWELTGDEIGPPCRAARLGVIVSKPHTLARELIEVWRSPRHDSLVVATQIEPADIVAHDEHDVRFFGRLLRFSRSASDHRDNAHQH